MSLPSEPEPNRTPPAAGETRRRGATLGKYRIVSELGRGGMGRVYAAEDTLLHRSVAIKVLASEVARDAQALERFLREARAAAKLSDPHVVAVHEIDQRDGRWFIVMERVTAGSLHDLLKKHGPPEWREATRLIADACRGLVAAHAAGLIHRDIKPANLMLTAERRVKVADFGLAKAGEDSGSLTSAGAVVGTPYYMSPEQWRAEQLTDLSDQYALGATYYALLTGQPPYAGREPMQVMYACCGAPPPDPRALRPDIPERCAEIVLRTMAKEPADRFPDAAALLRELERLLADAGSSGAGAQAGGLQVVGSQADPPQNSLVVAPLRTIALGGAAATTAFDADARTLTLSFRMPRTTRRHWLAGGAAAAGLAALGAFAWRRRGGEPESPLWKPLFNGRDMDGWWPRGGGENAWSVENGVLVGRGPEAYLYTRAEDFRNFRCRAEVSINAVGNGGIFFRCIPDFGLPQGYEAQVGAKNFGNLHRTLDQNGSPESSMIGSQEVPPDQWTVLEIVARGRTLEIQAGGKTLSTLTEREGNPKARPAGAFALQAYDAATVFRIRKLEWQELP